MGLLVYKNGKVYNVDTGKQYDGEKIPGDLEGWNSYNIDPNMMLKDTYGIMVARSLTLYHTTIIKGFVDKQADYAIGSGMFFRSQPDYKNIPGMSRERGKDWGKEFQSIVHFYCNKFNVYEKQRILFLSTLAAGDSLLFFLRGNNGFLSDLIEFGGDQIDWRVTDDAHTLGIKRDEYFRRKAIVKLDGKEVPFKDDNDNQNVVLFMFKQQARQMRGFPLSYGLINLVKNDDRHWDATTQRAVLESIQFGSFETDVSDPVAQARNMAKNNIKEKLKKGEEIKDSFFSRVFNALHMGGGNMYVTRKGEKVNFTDLKTPSNNFSSYKEATYDYIGAYTGTPSEVAMSKYNTSYTAHRGTLNDFKISFMYKRNYFKNNVAQVMLKEIAKDALKNKYISAPGFFTNPFVQFAYLQGNYLAPVLGVINPLQEVNAEKAAVDAAFKLRGDVALMYGNEWDNFLQEYSQQEREYAQVSVEKQESIIANNEGLEVI